MRAVLAIALLWAAPAEAADINADPNTYRNVLSGLVAGDRMILAPGEYPGLPIDGLEGTAQSPIVITGPESGAPAIITGRACCNTISIRSSSYLVIRHLDVDGRGELVDGVKAEGDSAYAHHITLEHLDLYNFGQDQQIVGINTKCPAWDWTIRFNTITGAGTGIYLGDSTGGQPFVRGLIEHNLILDPLGYDMQIKHQLSRPAGIGLPTQAITIIRHNVFIKAANASTGDLARPNLLVGHFPPSGDGSNDRYEIYGNFFFQNASAIEPLFQGEGRFTFHDNILVNTFGSGALVRPQNGEVKDVSIYHNTFLVAGSAVQISGGAGYTQRVVANAIFADGTPLSGGEQRDNVVETVASAGGYVNNPTTVLGALDLHPSGGGLSGAPVDLSPFTGDADAELDFNGTVRDPAWRGAYSGSGANPGWSLAEEIKTLEPGMNPRPDAGMTGDGGAADAGTTADGGTASDGGTTIDGSTTIDGGTIGGGEMDAGNNARSPGRTSGGCGCNASNRESGLMWIVVLFAFQKRLRQLARACF